MSPPEPPLQSPIQEKIRWANQAHQGLAARVGSDGRAADLLERLSRALERSSRAAAETRMGQICGACELEEGGSCCGEGLEDRYDARLLLINRLLGVELPEQRLLRARCYFLTRTGCLLRARHVICVNFLCEKLSGSIERDQLAHIKETEGEELETLFWLHDRLTRIIGGRG